MKYNDMPETGFKNYLQQGVHRVMIMECTSGESSVKKTPFVGVLFGLATDTTKAFIESMWVTDNTFTTARFRDLYGAAFPTDAEREAIDIPDNLLDADAHGALLIGRVIWISIDRWDETYYWGVTAFHPDSETAPMLIPAWLPKSPGTRTPRTSRTSSAPASTTTQMTPQAADAQDDDIPF